MTATAARNPAMRGITLARLQAEGAVPLDVGAEPPFAGGRFPTSSGKVHLYCESLAGMGLDPLPSFTDSADDGGKPGAEGSLWLVSPAAHHFVSSSLANQSGLLANEGEPFLEIHPADAAVRGIDDGCHVVIENGRGGFRAKARVTETVRPGVVASPKGRWAKRSGGRNVNWTTSDTLGDFQGQSTFHHNRVWVRCE